MIRAASIRSSAGVAGAIELLALCWPRILEVRSPRTAGRYAPRRPAPPTAGPQPRDILGLAFPGEASEGAVEAPSD